MSPYNGGGQPTYVIGPGAANAERSISSRMKRTTLPQVPIQTTRQPRKFFVRVLAPLVGLCWLVANASAGPIRAFSSASAQFINGSSQGFVANDKFSTPTSSHDRLSGPPGFAEAGIRVGPGTIALDTIVSLNQGQPVTLSAIAQGSFAERFTLGDEFCTLNGGCQTLGFLGVSYVDFNVGIHAAGFVNASRGTQFDTAIAGLNYNWSLVGSDGHVSAGGGTSNHRRVSIFDDYDDSVGDATALVRIRAGGQAELVLSAIGQAGGANAESFAKAQVIFGNTLRWDGVHAFTAYDSGGNIVNLSAGQFSLMGQDSGFDYWRAAAEPNNGVPEPGSLALMFAGLGLMGLRGRRGATNR